MPDPPRKESAYGTPSSDTSFRKTWDREEYTKKAAAEEARKKEESKARYDAKLAGKKYHAPVDFSALEATRSRSDRLNVASMQAASHCDGPEWGGCGSYSGGRAE
ncbi:hypothetical protein HCAG_06731 [Histoplasma mississippiense (nom. inval.)]|uniref:hypothetical protein n=1 Tax=Ajellomyces capsulatus (strain NAm1 / WU24) TaxID=2059318 RepID=UPI000157CB38|nr:hypothetical protein HCAG_06731 [Histoplasma mississippiense (nom. inval.)]EDN09564.1 hypothetical protein HCAG_06731 [Histoplasma mississippiense (nom. inval.)]